MTKHIDIKSLLIGILLASTVLLAIGATSPTDKWDGGQEWELQGHATTTNILGKVGRADFFRLPKGFEPFAFHDGKMMFRKRVK